MVALVRDHDRSTRCSGNPSTSLDRCGAFFCRRFAVDASETTKVSETTYHYDATGRMVQVDLDTDGDGNTDSTQTYQYDDRGLRVSQTDTATGETTTYLFDPQNHTGYVQVLEESVDTGSGATLEKTYTLGHDVIAQASATAAQVLTLLYDGHGNTRAVVDEVGEILQRYAYDAYGVMLSGTGLTTAAAALTRLLYSGEWTRSNGSQWLRGRDWFDPYTGRFTQPDPFRTSDPIALHKYLYAHANPVMGVDPTGRSIISTAVKVVLVLSIATMLVGLGVTFYGVGTNNSSATSKGLALTTLGLTGAAVTALVLFQQYEWAVGVAIIGLTGFGFQVRGLDPAANKASIALTNIRKQAEWDYLFSEVTSHNANNGRISRKGAILVKNVQSGNPVRFRNAKSISQYMYGSPHIVEGDYVLFYKIDGQSQNNLQFRVTRMVNGQLVQISGDDAITYQFKNNEEFTDVTSRKDYPYVIVDD